MKAKLTPLDQFENKITAIARTYGNQLIALAKAAEVRATPDVPPTVWIIDPSRM